jgi:hypothetical protein
MPGPVDYYKYARAFLQQGKHEQAQQCLQLAIVQLSKMEVGLESGPKLNQVLELKAKATFTMGHVHSAMGQNDTSGAWYLGASRIPCSAALRGVALANARLCFSRQHDVHKLMPYLNDQERADKFGSAISAQLNSYKEAYGSKPPLVLTIGDLSWTLAVVAALYGGEVIATVGSQTMQVVAQVAYNLHAAQIAQAGGKLTLRYPALYLLW